MPTTKISTTSILSKLKIKSLNEMQLASIEAIDKNNDVLLLSATGSGKTLAYLLPLLKLLNAANTTSLLLPLCRQQKFPQIAFYQN